MIRLSSPIFSAICRLETSPSIRRNALPLFLTTGKMNCSCTVNTAVQGLGASYSSSIHSETNFNQAVADKEKQSTISKQETKVNYSKIHPQKVRMPGSNSKRRRIRIDLGSGEINSHMEDFASGSEDRESSLPTEFGKKRIGRAKKSDSSERVSKSVNTKESSLVSEPFDICQRESNELQCLQNVDRHVVTKQEILRPGMVLLKHYLSHDSQVEIVKTCRELGMGKGGFYRPGYQDGAKLRLYMMCLGLDWDPETRRYEKTRRIDDAEVPKIPYGFEMLVMRAIEDAHDLIRTNSNESNVEDILPAMIPNICIANFYTASGRLGLHQDRDESRESLERGLPVVSFSIGDSAEFLYGDQRDKDMTERVTLESGDVVIFGGKSRHIFHGVESIIPHSAPKSLVEETGLREGRLNLTFRQY